MREDKQTAGQKPDLCWERAGAKGLAGSWVLCRVCLLPVGRRSSDCHSKDSATPAPSLGQGPKWGGWQSAGDALGQETGDSPSAAAIPGTGNFESQKNSRKSAPRPKKNHQQV